MMRRYLAPQTRISTTLNLVAALVGLALAAASFAAMHFAARISTSAQHIESQALSAVVSSAELGVLVERHVRIIERAPLSADSVRTRYDKELASAIAKHIQDIVAVSPSRAVAPVRRLLPDVFEHGGRVLELSEPGSREAALRELQEYTNAARRLQDRIVTFREYNLRKARQETSSLIASVGVLVNFILIATLFSAALAGPLSIWAMRRLANRLKRITSTMQALSKDNTDIDIPNTEATDEVGEMARAIAVFKANAIDLREKHKEIELLHARFDIALNNMIRGLCMFDGDGRLIVCNAICRGMYELPAAVMTPGTPFSEIIRTWALIHSDAPADETGAQVTAWLDEHARKVALGKEFSEIHSVDDGRIYSITTKPLPEGGWVDLHEDITEEQRSSERIADLAQKDTLTGLANRHSFTEELHATCSASLGRPFAILWIDLDRFKEVNDTHGHPAGDALLKIVGQRLKTAVRGSDFVARLGGDEFAIMIRGKDVSQPTLANIAARLTRVVCEPVQIFGHAVRVGASIGIASAPGDGATADEIMKSADIALYRAKAGGRGATVFYGAEMAEELVRRQRLQEDLENAIGMGKLELSYQPIVSLSTGKVGCLEALTRWHHADFGFIPPADFIPLAEEAGLIGRLGVWSLDTACAQAATWPPDVSVSVNISAAHVQTGGLKQAVASALAAANLAPDRLQLEVTEALLLEDNPQTWSTLSDLKALGVAIVLDDFGSGYSSLSHLRRFPFDKIKLDRGFLRGEGRKPDGLTIIRAVTDLAHTLGMCVVAEGVETAEQLLEIRQARCDEAQGYHFARPVPASQLADVLAQCACVTAAA